MKELQKILSPENILGTLTYILGTDHGASNLQMQHEVPHKLVESQADDATHATPMPTKPRTNLTGKLTLHLRIW